MKRALTITMTVALFASLMFMGFAGSAAAVQDAEQDANVDQDATAVTYQDQSVSQTNWNTGDQTNIALGGTATSSVDQSNENTQEAETTAENTAEIEQEIDQEIEDSFVFDL